MHMCNYQCGYLISFLEIFFLPVNLAFGVEDLSSKILLIQAKKFYVDVKQNKRGRFIKISEVIEANHFAILIFQIYG